MVSWFRQHGCRPVIHLTGRFTFGLLWILAGLIACGGFNSASADTTDVELRVPAPVPGTAASLIDTTFTPPSDTSLIGPQIPLQVSDSADQKRLVDSLMSTLRSDSAASDTTTPPSLRAFVPPNAVFDSVEQANARVSAVLSWPLPKPADLAVCDLAGWLAFQPPYDVDDASGPGQSRRYTKWGLIERRSRWDVDGHQLYWQRLDFPQTAQFDAVIIPSFDFDSVSAGDEVRLRRNPDWPYRAQSSYFLRQGDYGETYSQGQFRRIFKRGYGLDLGFAFYDNDGVYLRGSPHNRYLRLQLVGPLKKTAFWTVRFNQYRDKTNILPPGIYFGMRPERNDLMYILEGAAYHPPDSSDSSTGWTAGITLQSGKQDIEDITIDYKLYSRDKHWTFWGKRMLYGWLVNANAIYETLDLGDNSPGRWGASFEGQRTVPVGAAGAGFVDWKISDWDTDPPAIELSAALTPMERDRALIPTLRLERTRIVPSLFDRLPEERSTVLYDIQSQIVHEYNEVGDPSLNAEWRNEASVGLTTPSDSAHRVNFSVEGHVAYVENYTRWLDVSDVIDTAVYKPYASDARTIGLGVALHTPLFWMLEGWFDYAAMYAETGDHQRLSGYYPQKASAIVSWIAPQFAYKIDLRINSALLWWYGDSRIEPVPYTITPNAVRWDLSASARMSRFTFYYSVQNLLNFNYRTRAGQSYAIRRMRFGFDWHFTD